MVLVSILALTWLLQDTARRLVVVPGSYLLWLMGLFIESTPQVIFWIALLVIAGVLVTRSLTGRPRELNEQPLVVKEGTRRSRLAFWMTQLNQQHEFSRSEFSRGRLADFIDRLAVDVLSYNYRIPAFRVHQMLENGEIEAPAEMLELIEIHNLAPQHQEPAPLLQLRSLLNRISDFVRQYTSSPAAVLRENADVDPETRIPGSDTGSLDLELEVTLSFLEKQLEIHNDNESI